MHYFSVNQFLFCATLSSALMCGIIWFIQLVHYPLLAQCDRISPVFALGHHRRSLWVIIPLRMFEVVVATLPFFIYPVEEIPLALTVNAVGVFLITLITWGVEIPLHHCLYSGQSLSLGQREILFSRLIRNNWARTAIYTGRLLILLCN